MDTTETLLRLGLALAIGLLVGLERHWREREAKPGQRTAGLRTFGLSGLLGGLSGLLALGFPSGNETAKSILIAAVFIGYAAAMIIFKRAESIEDETFSVTSVIASFVVFLLGLMAVIGDKTIAAAAGVSVTALLASREVLHDLLRRMTWPELRSAIIILVMSFVALPLVPRTPIGPFGGIDFAEVWTLAILMALVAYVGYASVRILGERRGLLLAGALGGLASSTAVALTFARRSALGEGPSKALAAGAACAAAVSVLRIGGLAIALAPGLFMPLAAPLAASAIGFLVIALAISALEGTAAEIAPTAVSNPFDIFVILRFTAFIALASFSIRAGISLFGVDSLIPLAAVAGMADADAVVLSVTKLPAETTPVFYASAAIAGAIAGDIVAKTILANVLGSRSYGLSYAMAAITSIMFGAAAFALSFFMMSGQ